MKKTILLILAALLVVSAFGPARASTFDTNNTVFANSQNYWPWGDARNQRYQLWFSQSMMTGYTGDITSIRQFVYGSNTSDSSYNVNIYASTTSVVSGSLDADNPDDNRGANNTLIFSGNLDLNSLSTLTIIPTSSFNFDGSGNLLLDFIFNSFTGVGDFYDGPIFQAVSDNSDFVRVINHATEGNHVYRYSALRTEIQFGAAPLSPSIIFLGSGLLCLLGYRRFIA